MKPIMFEEQNCTMVGEQCHDLPVVKVAAPRGVEYVSCWQLTDEELELVKETKVIWLGCLNSQPPVFLEVEKPFVHIEEGVDQE